MATTATISGVPADEKLGECRHVAWTLAQGEAGDWIRYTEFADKSVQVGGTFGGASVSIHGSNDLTSPTNTNVLRNPFTSDAITRIAASLDHIAEMPLWIRPVVTGGDGTTAIVVNLVIRRGRTGK
jgi:hypothetical protein